MVEQAPLNNVFQKLLPSVSVIDFSINPRRNKQLVSSQSTITSPAPKNPRSLLP